MHCVWFLDETPKPTDNGVSSIEIAVIVLVVQFVVLFVVLLLVLIIIMM